MSTGKRPLGSVATPTIGAFVLFGDRLPHQFFLYAGIAIVAGIFISVSYPTQIGVSFERAGLKLSLKTFTQF